MAAQVSAPNSGVAFLGGAQSRNLAPPSVVGQGIPSANTNVASPQGGVNPGQMKQARPNEGSNIGIPYSRLVPLQNRNALFTPKDDNTPDTRPRLVTETEDLRATTIAFVLGLRGTTSRGVEQLGSTLGGEGPVYQGHNVGVQPAIMPGMVGTERFQQLCSLEYLHAYFDNVLSGKTIALGDTIAAIKTTLDASDKSSGPLGMIDDTQLGNSSLVKMDDLARKYAQDGASVRSVDDPTQKQGIFTCDYGPFLMGKGGETRLVYGTNGNLPDTAGGVTKQPYQFSRNLGDDVAFSVLDSLIAKAGLTDWRPDGLVLSKGTNDPSDKMSDEYLDARDGQLYNIRVQGPAVGTTWTGDRSMETLPLDKVFILMVADVWFDVDAADNATVKTLIADGINTKKKREEYTAAAKVALKEPFNKTEFEEQQKAAWAGTGSPVLANFRLVSSTSSQMVNYSQFKEKTQKKGGESASKKPRLEGISRMGLRLSNRMGEYVVGGWQIGNVLDTSASRAAMPQGSNIGVRTAPNSSALNINVNVGWWTADRLCRAFNNREGEITPRHIQTKRSTKPAYKP